MFMNKERIIFHIDVNNAFLSWTAVDMLRNGSKLDIRKIPSIIGGDEEKRHGVVLAKSPIAKKYGIKTAETIYSARKKCPNIKVYPANMLLYRNESNKLIEYIKNFSPVIEQFSIDECFMDMTGMDLIYDDLIKLAYKMKDEIKTKFGFTVNIGIANNKLCAKMASDFLKPDKVHTLFDDEIETKMWPLPVEDLFMAGRSTTEKLKELHIYTIKDLAEADINILTKHFKSNGLILKEHANGIDNSPVNNTYEKNKCISVSTTLPKDISDIKTLRKVLLRQAEEVGINLRKQKLYAKTIAVTIKNKDFISYSHQKKLHNQTHSSEVIYKEVIDLLEKAWRGEPIRNIGIRLSDLTEVKVKQVSLFDEVKDEKEDKIIEVIDNIKNKYGIDSIKPASLFEEN